VSDLVTRLRESTVTISEAMRQRKLAAGEIEYLREALAQQRRYYDELLADRDSLRAELFTAQDARHRLGHERDELRGLLLKIAVDPRITNNTNWPAIIDATLAKGER
jgi:chromosome segregation ATPase